jgi:hypothetical protein
LVWHFQFFSECWDFGGQLFQLRPLLRLCNGFDQIIILFDDFGISGVGYLTVSHNFSDLLFLLGSQVQNVFEHLVVHGEAIQSACQLEGYSTKFRSLLRLENLVDSRSHFHEKLLKSLNGRLWGRI